MGFILLLYLFLRVASLFIELALAKMTNLKESCESCIKNVILWNQKRVNFPKRALKG